MLRMLILVISIMSLAACGSKQKKPSITLVEQLQIMECEDLLNYRSQVQQKYNEDVISRETENKINIAVGVLGAISGMGGFATRGASHEEQDLLLNISTATSIAKQKGCDLPKAENEVNVLVKKDS